jgi:GTPase SAR1 family protein
MYDSVRPLSYADADLIMICFSVADPESLDHAISRVSNIILYTTSIFCYTLPELFFRARYPKNPFHTKSKIGLGFFFL